MIDEVADEGIAEQPVSMEGGGTAGSRNAARLLRRHLREALCEGLPRYLRCHTRLPALTWLMSDFKVWW